MERAGETGLDEATVGGVDGSVQVVVEHRRQVPVFGYTTDARATIGAELVLAGGAYLPEDDTLQSTLRLLVRALAGTSATASATAAATTRLDVEALGEVRFRWVDETWVRALVSVRSDGAPVLQVLLDGDRSTIDVPRMDRPWNSHEQPIWAWLHEPWVHPAPAESLAGTNLRALSGHSVTSAIRWEEDAWELVAGAVDEVTEQDARIVPLGTMLAADPSLTRVVQLDVGEGIQRARTGAPWTALDLSTLATS